jgi:hypothetical protein
LCHAIHTVHNGRIIGTYRNPSLADEPNIVVDILGAAPRFPAGTTKEQRDV